MTEEQIQQLRTFAFNQASTIKALRAYLAREGWDITRLGFDDFGRELEGQDAMQLLLNVGIDNMTRAELIKAYERSGEAGQGLCAGFSLEWIAAKLFDSASGRSGVQADRQAKLYDTDYLAAATSAQIAWDNAGQIDPLRLEGGTGEDLGIGQWPEGKALEYKVTAVMSPVVPKGQSKATLANPFVKRIMSEKGSATQLSFVPEGGGRHSVAFYRSHNSSVYLFDPNLGEYRVGIQVFQDFLASFLRVFYLQGLAEGEEPTPMVGWSLWRWNYVAGAEQRGLFKRYGGKENTRGEDKWW